MVVLEVAFATDDFGFSLVAGNSSTTTPALLKLTAMWSSQEGSLLLWAWLLSGVSSIALFVTRRKLRELVPYATAVMMAVGAFFTGLMLFGGVNPFTATNPVPIEGAGLQPLLRHWAMMIHPPMLYIGYVSFTIPFAFAIGALATRRLDASWIRATRRFALVAWTFLGIGLLLGAYWSYEELGWGGYWAWDPVENAAMMPWLIGTAFIHSVMVQEKRGMLKVWNLSLVIGAFALSLTGTFLVRSGVLQSIHAFGDSTVGPYMLGLIGAVLVGSAALLISRLDELRSEKRIESLLSRESVFLVNNLLLVSLTAVVLWGTFFPLISEAFTGEESSLAAPWFDTYTTPLAVGLVLFTGIGPLLAWRRMSGEAVRRILVGPAAVAALTAVVLLVLTSASERPFPFGLFVLAAFAVSALAQEYWRGGRARQQASGEPMPKAIASLVARNRRRYGGYVVHFGVIMLLVAIAASSSFQTKVDVNMRPGETTEVGDFTLTYERPTVEVTNEKIRFGAVVEAERDGEPYATLHPSREYFRPVGEPDGPIRSYFEGEATSEVGLESRMRRDLWTSVQPDLTDLHETVAAADTGFVRCLGGAPGTPRPCTQLAGMMQAAADRPELRPAALAQVQELQSATIRTVAGTYEEDTSAATFRVIVNPFVTWLWIGALIALAGALVALWPGAGLRRRSLGGLAGARRSRQAGQEPSGGSSGGGEAPPEGSA